jgi:predicted extracellular nuclease
MSLQKTVLLSLIFPKISKTYYHFKCVIHTKLYTIPFGILLNPMKYLYYPLIFLVLISCNEDEVSTVSVGFYNVENLFDTKDDPKTNDNQFTPSGDKEWDNAKYAEKLQNLAKVISQLADDKYPTFLGVCEVENKKVLQDLAKQPALKQANYGVAHIESPDERGIDVGLLYNKSIFKVNKITAYQPNLSSYNDKTRDILYVKGELANGEILHFMINHWPSRGGGRKESEPKRIAAAQMLLSIQKEIQAKDPDAKIIVMGDFNDEPSNQSISKTLNIACDIENIENNQLFNAFCELEKQDYGSYRYRGYWDMLDQIMISKSLITDTVGIHFTPNSAGIKSESWMIQTGKYEGFPLRTYGGNKYLAGYSDHLPVYISLQGN